MGYPCQVFDASELPSKIQSDLRGRKRKLPSAAREIDLAACPLLEMLQYKCEIKEPIQWDSPVQCFAIERLFRQCEDRRGSFMVETTAWEGKSLTPMATKKGDEEKKPQKHYNWSSSWHDADQAP